MQRTQTTERSSLTAWWTALLCDRYTLCRPYVSFSSFLLDCGGEEEDFTAETSRVVELQWQFSEVFKRNHYNCACAIVISILKLDEADWGLFWMGNLQCVHVMRSYVSWWDALGTWGPWILGEPNEDRPCHWNKVLTMLSFRKCFVSLEKLMHCYLKICCAPLFSSWCNSVSVLQP